MIRWLLPLLLLVPMASEAGVRATYRLDGEKTPVRVEVADNGDASIMVDDDGMRLAVIDGHVYVINDIGEGLETFRLADVTAVLAKAGELKLDDPLPFIPKGGHALRVMPLGDRTIKGQAAKTFRIVGLDLSQPSAAIEVSALTDPLYAPIGQALACLMEESAGLINLFAAQSPGAAELFTKLSGVFKLGTPLAMRGAYELETIETVSLSPALIALPSAPKDPAVLLARMREAQAEK